MRVIGIVLSGIIVVAVTVFLTLWLRGAYSEPTVAEREDQFWSELQIRTNLVGSEYADPARAKAGAIEYGRWICGRLATGVDQGVFLSQGAATGNFTREEFTAQVDTAVEFLCPEQAQ